VYVYVCVYVYVYACLLCVHARARVRARESACMSGLCMFERTVVPGCVVCVVSVYEQASMGVL